MEKKLNYWEGKFRELDVSEDVTNVFKKKNDDNDNKELTDKDVESIKKELKNIEIRDIKDDDKKVKNIVTFVGNAFKFEYVGIIALQIEDNFYIIKCYPKYFNKEPSEDDFKQILQVIHKYNSKYQINWYDIYDDGEKDFNKLEASLYIINDYLKNGLYSNQNEEIELNGEGEILWDKSINENIAFIQNKKPYYLDLFTRNVIDNENDFFRRLHACVISECIRYLKDIEKAGCDLFKLCDVNCDELTDAVIDDFGSTEYILYRLESEIRVQYITQKQNLLKLLHTYIEKKDNIQQNDVNCSLFGSANFHCIWEDVCTNVFNDHFKEHFNDTSDENSNLKKEINKPKWSIGNNKLEADKTLEPDIIVEEEIGGERYFGIYDAKYYCIEINEVDKKIKYQLSFKDYIKKQKKIKFIENILLFPDFFPAKYEVYNIDSFVTIDVLQDIINPKNQTDQNLDKIGSGIIRLVWLNTKDMYEKYLKGDKIIGNDIFKYIPSMTKRLIK